MCYLFVCCCFSIFGCLFLFLLFYLFIFFYFDRNQKINNTMKLQEASCPSLAVSVLSSSVEPQSLAVSVS